MIPVRSVAKCFMPILRKREIENLEQLSGEELQAFIDSLPAGQDTISELLDYRRGRALRTGMQPQPAVFDAVHDGKPAQLSEDHLLAKRQRRLLRLQGNGRDRPDLAGEVRG